MGVQIINTGSEVITLVTNAAGALVSESTLVDATGVVTTDVFDPATENVVSQTTIAADGNSTTENYDPTTGILESTVVIDPTTEVTTTTEYNAYGAPTEVITTTPSGTTIDMLCLLAGTQVTTPGGVVNVEDLAIGDAVMTSDGKVAPIQWIGRRVVATAFADRGRDLPVRVRAGALGENLPARDLLVSPCHALLVEGVLVHAGAIVNGTTIVRETVMPAMFVYYHIELEDHSLILAEGVAAETFVDNADRMSFDNWKEHLQLYPEGRTVKELPYARAASARQVPQSVQRLIASRVPAVSEPVRQTG
jgi:hypothetical protein